MPLCAVVGVGLPVRPEGLVELLLPAPYPKSAVVALMAALGSAEYREVGRVTQDMVGEAGAVIQGKACQVASPFISDTIS